MANKDFSPVFLRNATAYGVSPRMRFDLVLNNLMGWAQTTGTIKVMSDGTPWRPMVHIEDISRAALAAVEAPLECVHNEPFNIGRNDSNYTVLQIAEAVAACVENSKIEVTGESGPDIRSYRVDFSKANAELPGFHPQWDLTKGCEELKRWFSEGGLQGKDFQSRFFVRLKQLNFLRATGILDDQLRFRNV
jgi:nucleoside-diphosphate-sugar epimerase